MTNVAECMEASAVRQEELDSLLRLMCGVFDMDFDAAHPIFYSDPYFEIENKRVLRVDSEIVSCLTLVERECWLGQSVLKIAGIAGVATRPELQRRGYAGRLLADTLSVYKNRGYPLSALFPYSPDYYRKFGWEIAGEIPRSCVSPLSLPRSSETRFIRLADEGDLPELARLYDDTASGQAFHCLRDEKRWRYLFTYVQGKVVYAPDANRVEGYLFYDYQPVSDPSGSDAPGKTSAHSLRVLEIAVESERAKRGLIGHLARQTLVSSIEFMAPRAQLLRFGFTPTPRDVSTTMGTGTASETAFMARILDWNGLIQGLLQNWKGFEGEIGLILHDPLLSSSAEAILVSGDGREATANRVYWEQTRSLCPDYLEGDVRGWSPVAVGHVTPQQACQTGTLKPSTQKALHLASQLFPERSPFLPTADHF